MPDTNTERFDEIFPGCCQAALCGLMASGLSKDATLMSESLRIGNMHAGAIVARQATIDVERFDAKLAAEKQAFADAEQEKQDAADEKARQEAYRKRAIEREKEAAHAKKYAPRVAGAKRGKK